MSIWSDGGWRGAGYVGGSGTKVLSFRYAIHEDDTDTDGITIRASDSAGSHGLVGEGIDITDEEFGDTANRAYSKQSDLSGHKRRTSALTRQGPRRSRPPGPRFDGAYSPSATDSTAGNSPNTIAVAFCLRQTFTRRCTVRRDCPGTRPDARSGAARATAGWCSTVRLRTRHATVP